MLMLECLPLTAPRVPHLHRVIERARDDAVAALVEAEGDDLCGVAAQGVQRGACTPAPSMAVDGGHGDGEYSLRARFGDA